MNAAFWSKVDQSGTCWLWTAGLDMHGYGKFHHAGKSVGAHRFAYIEAHGGTPAAASASPS